MPGVSQRRDRNPSSVSPLSIQCQFHKFQGICSSYDTVKKVRVLLDHLPNLGLLPHP